MISATDLAAWLGAPSEPSEPGVTALLTALEVRAVDFIQRETGRYFGVAAARTEYLLGDDGNVLRLAEDPSAVTTVEYRTYVGESWTAIVSGDDDGWELRRSPDGVIGARLLRKSGSAWSSCYEYKVTYSFGYTADAEPGEIRQAVMDLVALKYQERGREGLKAEAIGDYSYSTLTDAYGRRGIAAVPGLAEVIARWRGLVYA